MEQNCNSPTTATNRIKRLEEVVVNKIAAGEVIQRPANAVKEMLENSLDAQSTNIQITVMAGGLKYLQIKDNGTGINRDDLEIVCERFTTSKLQNYEDLTSVATFGFRGEALSSISHVAHLTIETRTNKDICAYKASYENGKIKSAAKPCAGNIGTTITIENIFYNVPQRKQILKSPSEEYQKICDIVGKYAIHNSNVGMIFKKFGENPTIKTSANATIVDNIKSIFGQQIAKEIMEIELEDEILNFKLKGFVSNTNYSNKKTINLIFINNRLVESEILKSSVNNAYSDYLPRGTHPFIYFDLKLNSKNVDVNVHPTKHKVTFLNEDEIADKIKSYIESKLLGMNSTKTFYKQTLIQGSSEPIQNNNDSSVRKEVYAKDLVRTDSKEQKLDRFLTSQNNQTKPAIYTQLSKSVVERRKTTKLSSILGLRTQIENECSTHTRTILKDMVFVGVVNKKYAVIQFESQMLLCDTMKLSYELFYQLLVYNFQSFKEFRLNPPVSINELILMAIDLHEIDNENVESDIELAKKITEIITSKAPLLKEYFGCQISTDGNIETLPIILEDHRPSMTYLPLYLLRLGTQIDWLNEENCFKSFFNETAKFYSFLSDAETNSETQKWQVEHILYPAFKKYLIPNSSCKNVLFELTRLQNLYKVFERC